MGVLWDAKCVGQRLLQKEHPALGCAPQKPPLPRKSTTLRGGLSLVTLSGLGRQDKSRHHCTLNQEGEKASEEREGQPPTQEVLAQELEEHWKILQVSKGMFTGCSNSSVSSLGGVQIPLLYFIV